jgi:predicted nucleic acid-binding protein
MVILDTNIIIDHLRQNKNKKSKLVQIASLKPKEALAISTISVQELYEGKSTKEAKKEQLLLATISPLKILPYTYETAKLAGQIARDLPINIELADAAIAATAILSGSPLFTLNHKHFQNIPQLNLYSLNK